MHPLDKPHYNLRPQDKRELSNEPVGGLGFLQESIAPPKTSSRKMNISKAQIKAKHDIVDGKKLSLKGSLRVALAPMVVSK